MSPEEAALPVVTSPSRIAGSTTTTTAPPKSALAKPRVGSAGASARKSAHVVVPGPSPKSSAKAGSSSRQGADDGSSPGHTPYPSKAKVKAATAAADRSCSVAAASAAAGAAGSKAGTAAGTSSSVSHKKEVGYARAHSALKQYASKSATAEQQQSGSTPGASAKKAAAASPGVSSRLLQPTASYTAKTKAAAAADADPLVWSPPLTPEASDAAASQGGSSAAAAGAAASRPRLASKVVVPSPAAGSKAGREPSMAALKRSIKEKMAAKAQATVQEHGSSSAGQVRCRVCIYGCSLCVMRVCWHCTCGDAALCADPVRCQATTCACFCCLCMQLATLFRRSTRHVSAGWLCSCSRMYPEFA